MQQLKPYALMTLDERATWDHRAAQMMEKIGGKFASALALAFFCADATNRARILGAFGDLFDLYRNRAFEQRETRARPQDQAAQG